MEGKNSTSLWSFFSIKGFGKSIHRTAITYKCKQLSGGKRENLCKQCNIPSGYYEFNKINQSKIIALHLIIPHFPKTWKI